MKKFKNKGITLIALVITIIILLILSGVVISQLSESGLINKTEQAKIETRYKAAKEQINMELMLVQTQCFEQKKEYNIKEIALNMKESGEITINKVYNKEIASISEGIEINEESIEAIVISVDNYSEFNFLIGESTKIEGVLNTEKLDMVDKTDFIQLEEFEKNIFKVSKMEGTTITYTTEPEGYTTQDSIKLAVKISNPKGIKTVEFPDGGKVECFGSKEYAKDFLNIVNGTYEYKVVDMDGIETIKNIVIDKIDKLAPLDFTPEVQKDGDTITIIENGQDAEADGTSSKSGIDYYEYYVIDEKNKTIKYETNKIDKLTVGTYKVYVIAYDKAGNSRKSSEVIIKISLQFINIFSSDNSTFAIDNKGKLWGWGGNSDGILLDGTTNSSYTPIQVMKGTKITQISGGTSHWFAIDEEGNTYAWGSCYSGQLGNGVDSPSSSLRSPTIISREKNFTKISAGYAASGAIDKLGNLWAWGNEDYLRFISSKNVSNPTQITSNTKFTDVSIGEKFGVAIDENKKIWTWGSSGPKLGKGNSSYYNGPSKIAEQTNFKSISTGSEHALAIDENGNIWSWGTNMQGQLGTGDTNTRTVSERITNRNSIRTDIYIWEF